MPDEAWERLEFQTAMLSREFEDAPGATGNVRDALDAAHRLSSRLGEQRALVSEADGAAAALGHQARLGFAEVEALEQRLEGAAQSARTSFGALESAAAAEAGAATFAAHALDRLQVVHEAIADQRANLGGRAPGGLWADR